MAPDPKVGHPGSSQGTPVDSREPESRRPLSGTVASPEGANVGASAAAPPASGPMSPGARDRTAEAAAPPARTPSEAPRDQLREPAVRELSVALPAPSANGRQAEQVSLRVVERAGEVQVAVRTADPQLADALRQNLGDLVSELAGRGYRTETWQPLTASGTEASALPPAAGVAPTSDAGRGFSGQAGDGFRNGGNPAGQQQHQQQRQGQDPNEPSWLQALARSAVQTGSITHDRTD